MFTEYIWFKNGKEYRRTADEVGKLISSKKLPNGGMVLYEYYDDGSILNAKYYNSDNRLHRDGDEPAITKYFKDGSIDYVTYWNNNRLHRDGDEPASIEYDRDGNITRSVHFRDGARV
jgi:antitoxin component YwqK of YwqJK toxin-antitoxin module